jgi:hypothetical protein
MPKQAPEIAYYVLSPVFRNERTFVNASVGRCLLCGNAATGMGGSGSDICRGCGDLLMGGNVAIAVSTVATLVADCLDKRG